MEASPYSQRGSNPPDLIELPISSLSSCSGRSRVTDLIFPPTKQKYSASPVDVWGGAMLTERPFLGYPHFTSTQASTSDLFSPCSLGSLRLRPFSSRSPQSSPRSTIGSSLENSELRGASHTQSSSASTRDLLFAPEGVLETCKVKIDKELKRRRQATESCDASISHVCSDGMNYSPASTQYEWNSLAVDQSLYASVERTCSDSIALSAKRKFTNDGRDACILECGRAAGESLDACSREAALTSPGLPKVIVPKLNGGTSLEELSLKLDSLQQGLSKRIRAVSATPEASMGQTNSRNLQEAVLNLQEAVELLGNFTGPVQRKVAFLVWEGRRDITKAMEVRAKMGMKLWKLFELKTLSRVFQSWSRQSATPVLGDKFFEIRGKRSTAKMYAMLGPICRLRECFIGWIRASHLQAKEASHEAASTCIDMLHELLTKTRAGLKAAEESARAAKEANTEVRTKMWEKLWKTQGPQATLLAAFTSWSRVNEICKLMMVRQKYRRHFENFGDRVYTKLGSIRMLLKCFMAWVGAQALRSVDMAKELQQGKSANVVVAEDGYCGNCLARVSEHAKVVISEKAKQRELKAKMSEKMFKVFGPKGMVLECLMAWSRSAQECHMQKQPTIRQDSGYCSTCLARVSEHAKGMIAEKTKQRELKAKISAKLFMVFGPKGMLLECLVAWSRSARVFHLHKRLSISQDSGCCFNCLTIH